MKQKRIFDDAELATVGAGFTLDDMRALSTEMREIVALLYEHVNGGEGTPLCGAIDFDPDLLVDVAFASDCDQCRAALLVGPTAEHAQREVPTWEPQPLEGADGMLEEKRKRSDGQ